MTTPKPRRLVGAALALNPDPDRARELFARTEAEHLRFPFREGVDHLIYGIRQEGKTTLAMEWLLDPEFTHRRRLVVLNRAIELDLKRQHGLRSDDPRILSWRQLKDRGPEKGVEYGFDELLPMLVELLGLAELPHLVTIGIASPSPLPEGSHAISVQLRAVAQALAAEFTPLTTREPDWRAVHGKILALADSIDA